MTEVGAWVDGRAPMLTLKVTVESRNLSQARNETTERGNPVLALGSIQVGWIRPHGVQGRILSEANAQGKLRDMQTERRLYGGFSCE